MKRQMPSSVDYSNALRNLQNTLYPKHLKQYKCVMNKRNTPMMISGGFVVTGSIKDPATNDRFALRMFKHLSNDMDERYVHISKFTKKHYSQGIFAEVDYIKNGILVNGETYPICLMEWLEGDTLRKYILNNLNSKHRLQALPSKFLELIRKLRKIGGAHGDLSHENIMVVNHELKLVDYDGMFVPALNGFPPIVAGQPNFQHPDRATSKDYFGRYQDHFSAIALYVSLYALAIDPTLYDRYKNGSNSLLFKKSDFEDPNNSQYMNEIRQLDSKLKNFIEQFTTICKGKLLEVPSLEDFLKGKTHTRAVSLYTSEISEHNIFTTENNPVFPATTTNTDWLQSSIGHVATVAGRVHEAIKDDEQYLLRFYTGSETTFVVFIEGDGYNQYFTSALDYTNQWVKITGLVEMNMIEGQDIPCIVVDNISDVEIKTREEINNFINTGNDNFVSNAPKAQGNKKWLTNATSTIKHNTDYPNTGNVDNLFKPKP